MRSKPRARKLTSVPLTRLARCYFNEHLLKPFITSPLLDKAKLDQYFYVGGVRSVQHERERA